MYSESVWFLEGVAECLESVGLSEGVAEYSECVWLPEGVAEYSESGCSLRTVSYELVSQSISTLATGHLEYWK